MNRLARRARDLVDTWPRRGWAVGAAADPADPGWAGEAAEALTRVAAERRRPAFLLDLAPECTDLATRFDAVGARGFGEAVAGDARLAQVAHRDEEHGVAYLPCGRRASGSELAGSEKLAAFAERVRQEGGVLLVVLDREGADAAASAGWPDGWVLLGDPEAATGGGSLPGNLPEMGRIEPREKGRSHGGPDGRPGDDEERWRRHRTGSSFPGLKAAGAALLLAALAGAWWWYADRATGGSGEPGTTADVAAADVGSSAAPAGEAAAAAASDSGTARGGSPGAASTDRDTASAAGAPDRGRRLGYSVLIASYASAEDARDRARELSEGGDGLFFVAPTPVRGSVWHRVYAGAVADRKAAGALMERLVEAGAKGEVRAWDVRPVPWSFRVAAGVSDRSRAEARAEQLRARGIPAYVVPGGGSYHVYSGAFESRRAAGALRERLDREGIEAELVRRAGAPR